MFKKKKNTRTFLYAEIKNRQENPVNSSLASSEKKASIKRKLVVTTTSLKNGVGCSYVGLAVANYLAISGKEKTCFLHKACGYVNEMLNDDVDSIFYPCNMGEVYSNYGYIVYDGGTINDIDRGLLDRSDIKVMMCWPNDEYIRLLADFINSRSDINNWVFLFNNVPDSKQSKVHALMEDYSACCVPVFSADHLDKKMKQIFNKIFYEK